MSLKEDLNNSSIKINKENVKTNLEELFKNPRLIGELYKNLSLSDANFLNYLEKLSHYSIVKKLYQSIPNMDKFASSSKTLKGCFKGNIEDWYFFYMAFLPLIFSSFKELYMGKTSRQSYLNRLNDEDLQELRSIAVTPNNLSNKQIISEIRNALNHTHYVPGKNELFIRNPQNSNPKIHARDFVADVPYSFLLEFIILTHRYYRKSDYYELNIEDPDFLADCWENQKNIKYDNIKDKIHFIQGVSSDDVGEKKLEKEEMSFIKKEISRSQQIEDVISKYFSTHKLDQKNLIYIAESLVKPPEVHMQEIFSAIGYNDFEGSKYKGLNSPQLVKDVYSQMFNYYYGHDTSIFSKEGKEIMTGLYKELENKNQANGNGQPLLKHFYGCVEYAYAYLQKRGFLPGKDKDSAYFQKGDIKIDLSSLCTGIYEQCSHYYAINNMVKLFPSWLRLQLIKLVYVNEQIPLQNDDVEGLITKIDTSKGADGKARKNTRERIRDALSHHTYFLLQGVDDIVLRDGYDKRTDSWAREATFSLSQLFEHAFKEINENSIVSSYDSLVEFLKSLKS